MLRVLPDQASGALLQRIRKTAFTYTRDSRVGLDSHYGVGLIEQRIRIGWRVSPYSRDLHLEHLAPSQLQIGLAAQNDSYGTRCEESQAAKSSKITRQERAQKKAIQLPLTIPRIPLKQPGHEKRA